MDDDENGNDNEDTASTAGEEPAMAERSAEARRRAKREVEVEMIDAVRLGGDDSPVTPVRLTSRDSFRFSCHRGVECWNRCCHGTDITLTPNDILRLCRRLGMPCAEFLAARTVPAMWDKADMPVAKLKMGGDDGKGPCPFVAGEGCTVYDDRPLTCRYYPLGLVSMKMKGGEEKEDFCFMVRESHCLGHREEKAQSVAEFRRHQGIEEYDRVNRGWTDILMKMASWRSLGGPMGKEPTTRVKQMFFMVSTDVEALRRFVFETKFLEAYEIDPEVVEVIQTDDEILLQMGFDWMKNVMFNEPTISLKETVLKEAIAKARERVGGA